MSVQSAKDFLKKFSKDSDFRTKLESAADDAARQALTKAAGFDFSKAELQEVTGGGSAELSDDDLEKVAGGSAPDWVGAGATVVGAVAAAF
ncbi:MAG: Nif11-like leader peptide family RiPP precursor [Deltaproteobacteria bacterium]|nr:Nif11-like leader peptide family RiPP precursor [Deltaproteobacteria bacterium]